MASTKIPIANDENATPTIDAKAAMENNNSPASSPRRVLGGVSPNVRSNFQSRPMAGSPLKRSFTAMAEEGAGFTYFKKRKLSTSQSREDTSIEPLNAASPDEQPDAKNAQHNETFVMPTIQEPAPSPTEPNTPSDDGEHDSGASSTDRHSFSSLINYDPSSQGTHLVLAPTTRAEMLKLRLRVAMYKVRTNQVNVPFAELRLEGSALPTATSRAVEAAVASLREEARQAEASSQLSQSAPKLLPAPSLKPTAYSSRMIYEQTMPSSPPSESQNQDDDDEDLEATPRQRVHRMNSSPHTIRKPNLRFDETELTSSVVKGRVAEGLLGLRNAA